MTQKANFENKWKSRGNDLIWPYVRRHFLKMSHFDNKFVNIYNFEFLNLSDILLLLSSLLFAPATLEFWVFYSHSLILKVNIYYGSISKKDQTNACIRSFWSNAPSCTHGSFKTIRATKFRVHYNKFSEKNSVFYQV